MRFVRTPESWEEIARAASLAYDNYIGSYTDYKRFTLSSKVPNIESAEVRLWSAQDAGEVNFAAARLTPLGLNVEATSGVDRFVNGNAKSVIVRGVGENYEWVEEEVKLNSGSNPTVNKFYFACEAFVSLGNANQGNINIKKGVATHCRIPALEGVSRGLIWVNPNTHWSFIHGIYFSTNTDATEPLTVRIRVNRKNEEGYLPVVEYEDIFNTGRNYQEFSTPIAIPPLGELAVTGQLDGTGPAVFNYARLEMSMVKASALLKR